MTGLILDAYTRPVSEHKINKMLRRGFDWMALQTISLSERPSGQLAVLDGHHRIRAGRKVGMLRMYARIYSDLTYEREAELFEKFNTQNKPTALDRFRARLEYNEANACQIQEILSLYELQIGLRGVTLGSIQSVGAIDRLFQEQGPSGLAAVISILWHAWQLDRKAYVQTMVDGMRQFWARYHSDVDSERLITQLQALTPDQVLVKSGVNVVKSATPSTMVGRQVLEQYNLGLRRNRLPDWAARPDQPRRPREEQEYDEETQ